MSFRQKAQPTNQPYLSKIAKNAFLNQQPKQQDTASPAKNTSNTFASEANERASSKNKVAAA